jgi:YVTN family beta-propeller protein
MQRFVAIVASALVFGIAVGSAQPSSGGPYKVLKTARVGGEGGWDYIYADAAGRRLYIPRRDPASTRLTMFNLDTLEPLGEIKGVGGNGTVVDPVSGHGFTSSKPVAIFDIRTMKLLKTIDVGAAQPDGIFFDAFNAHVYVFSHPTEDATVIDAKDGTVLGTIKLGGEPEQGVADGKGTLYVVLPGDEKSSVAVVDVKTMKATAHYALGDTGDCAGLALDEKNHVLFAACGESGNPPDPAKPMMVILSATTGKILTSLRLTGGSDGAVFNPETMEAFCTLANGTLTVVKETSPTTFELEQNLKTMNGARTITLDGKTGHVLTMSQEFAAPAAPARRAGAPPSPAAGRGRDRGAVVPGSFTILMIGR